jgi:hypothetical protein
MNLYEMAQKVDSKKSFLRFVQALADDARAASTESKRTVEGKLNLSPRGWENGTISSFLEAMLAWAAADSTQTGKPCIPDEPSWQLFAMVLYAGKRYE